MDSYQAMKAPQNDLDDDDFDEMPPLVQPEGARQILKPPTTTSAAVADLSKKTTQNTTAQKITPKSATGFSYSTNPSLDDEDEYPAVVTERKPTISVPTLKKPPTETKASVESKNNVAPKETPKDLAKPSQAAPDDDLNELPPLIPAGSSKSNLVSAQPAAKPAQSPPPLIPTAAVAPKAAKPMVSTPSTADEDDELPDLIPAHAAGTAAKSTVSPPSSTPSKAVSPGDVAVTIGSRELKRCLSFLQDAAFRVTKDGVEIVRLKH
jgi:hypothetical protein